MWTRPDGFAYIAALALAHLLFGEPPQDETPPRRVFGPRKKMVVATLGSGAVCALLYLPWFVWAWSYYGSPVPHTVLAKTGLGQPPVLKVLREAPAEGVSWAAHALHVFQSLTIQAGERAQLLFQGIYTDEEFHWKMVLFNGLLGMFAALYWLFPVKERLGRMASFCFALLIGYLSFLYYVFPWYMPAVTLFALVALSQGLASLAGGTAPAAAGPGPPTWLPSAGRVLAVVLAIVICTQRAYMFGMTVVQMKIQQQEVEVGHRMRIGLWLKEHMHEGDTLYLEPVGYIGYFSGAHVYDWPGLVSPEVVRLHREKGLDALQIPEVLKPDWIVLRKGEAERMSTYDFVKDYELVKSFDIHDRLEAYGYIPGKEQLTYDESFKIFKRKASRSPAPPVP
jgi:hypothetical protein